MIMHYEQFDALLQNASAEAREDQRIKGRPGNQKRIIPPNPAEPS